MKTEYKVVPAPEKARKQKGLKGAALFAHAMEEVMNEFAADGWQYLRTDTLPQEERSGLTSKTTTYRNLLVFQRLVEVTTDEESIEAAEPTPPPDPAPDPDASDDDEVTNLWHPTEDDTPDPTDPPEPLFPDRQRQRVDL